MLRREAEALEALWTTEGHHRAGHLQVRVGARHDLTELGQRFDGRTWGNLRARGLVEAFRDERGDGVRLTGEGKAAARRGTQAQDELLARARGLVAP